MKFKVDRDTCQSAGTCTAFLTKGGKTIYELDDESKAVIIGKGGKRMPDDWIEVKDLDILDIKEDENLKELEKTVVESAKSCPFLAIIIKDDSGKQIWPEE